MKEMLKMPARKAEKKIAKTAVAVESPMMLDESLYKLEVENVRHEGKKRERKGVMTAIKSFLNTPQGKMLGMQMMAGTLFVTASSNAEQLISPRFGRPDVYDVRPSEDIEEMRDELTVWLGEDQVSELIPVESAEEIRSARREMREAPILEIGPGFAAHDIETSVVQSYLEHGFPRFMVSSTEVSRMDVLDEHLPMRADYHMPAGTEAAGTCSVAPAGETSEILLYGAMMDHRGRLEIQSAFGQVVIHELGHGMDMTNLAGLAPDRRISMLHQMVDHVRSEGEHLPFSYIESINDQDAQEQLHDRTTEYYAEFISGMFRHTPVHYDERSGSYHEYESPVEATADALIDQYSNTDTMPQKDALRLFEAVRDDVQMIRDLIQELDPSFDWAEAYGARLDSIAAMETGRTLSVIREYLNSIEDSAVREELNRRLDLSQEAEPRWGDIASFAMTAGTDRRLSNDIGEAPSLDYRFGNDARRLEQRVQQEQERSIREIANDLSPIDRTAFDRLTALMEEVSDSYDLSSPWFRDEALMSLNDSIGGYLFQSEHATPAHREAAFRYMQIMEGDLLSKDLRSDIASLLRRIDEDTSD